MAERSAKLLVADDAAEELLGAGGPPGRTVVGIGAALAGAGVVTAVLRGREIGGRACTSATPDGHGEQLRSRRDTSRACRRHDDRQRTPPA